MKKILLIALSCFFLTGLSAQTDTNYKEKHPYKDWVKIAPKFDDAFFKTPSALPTMYYCISKLPEDGLKTFIWRPN